MEYYIKDLNDNTIISESETVVVKTQTSFFKTIHIPKNLKIGDYAFIAIAKYGNSVGTGSYLFEVIDKKPEEIGFFKGCKKSVGC